MESEPTTINRLETILELESTGAQDIIASLLFADSSYDHNIQLSTLGLQRWNQAMILRFSGKLLFFRKPEI
jgi:hypothetical protein